MASDQTNPRVRNGRRGPGDRERQRRAEWFGEPRALRSHPPEREMRLEALVIGVQPGSSHSGANGLRQDLEFPPGSVEADPDHAWTAPAWESADVAKPQPRHGHAAETDTEGLLQFQPRRLLDFSQERESEVEGVWAHPTHLVASVRRAQVFLRLLHLRQDARFQMQGHEKSQSYPPPKPS